MREGFFCRFPLGWLRQNVAKWEISTIWALFDDGEFTLFAVFHVLASTEAPSGQKGPNKMAHNFPLKMPQKAGNNDRAVVPRSVFFHTVTRRTKRRRMTRRKHEFDQKCLCPFVCGRLRLSDHLETCRTPQAAVRELRQRHKTRMFEFRHIRARACSEHTDWAWM